MSDHTRSCFTITVVQKPGFMSVVDTKSWQGGSARVTEGHAVQIELTSKPAATQPRRNVGGRRPNKDKSVSINLEKINNTLNAFIVLLFCIAVCCFCWTNLPWDKLKWLEILHHVHHYRFPQKKKKDGLFGEKETSLQPLGAANDVWIIQMNWWW